ncbi:glycosyltransferase family 4 protein [Raoultella planticola]|uniref:glycosyltransferase family 4 protein n=1 Tax=Raoultella planticola TaxID=575 RepID=UPI001C9D8C7F|nr:glycosyltransferase family 1 protein [Raoultella planticola]MDM9677903.1 glycosyltransferase family 1 protein [Raoultella planticola]QZS65868.1 glycosyltransferase family 4 protein [Raoultella planticola]
MVAKVFIDPRWKNAGGIGTFYEEINKINKYEEIFIKGNPVSPLDTLSSAKALSSLKNSVVFFPGYIPPLFSRIPFIFTIHDLNHLDREENSSTAKKIFYNTIIKKGCRSSSYIFTVSDFSRERIIEWSGVNENKVINVGNGVSPKFSPDGEMINLDYEYFLCVSNRKAHKNELGTIKAFSAANIDKKIKLVFTGKPNDEVQRLISTLGIQERVIFTGFIEAGKLPKLYRTAKALIFPSFYEGFGLPVIEAQASGIPVITSNNTSLGEISGGAAFLVEPTDVNDIVQAIELVCNNTGLVMKNVKAGLDNAKKYNWEKTSNIVDKYINKVI